MTVFTKNGKYHEAGSATIHIVGGDVGDISMDELNRLKDAQVAEVRPLLRTRQMVEEFMHHRASHVVTLLPGAVDLLTAWRGLAESNAALETAASERDRYYALYSQESREATVQSIRNDRALRAMKEKVRTLKRELAKWGPSFSLEGIPVFLLRYSGSLKGARPAGKGVSAERQHAYLAKKATYKPSADITEVGYYCHKSKRVAWKLKSGVVVVDDFGPSLAVHIVNSIDLAKDMVSKAVTIAEARKSPHHLARVEHGDGYEETVAKALEECA